MPNDLLKRALYGFKQSVRSWNQRIDFALKENGFIQSKADLCVYIKNCDDELVYILFYVDDLLICGNAVKVKETAALLSQHFELKDLGEVISLYLGIQVERDSHGNFMLSQIAKIQQIISEFCLTDAKVSAIPMHADYLDITGDENLLPSNEQYRQAMGALLHHIDY